MEILQENLQDILILFLKVSGVSIILGFLILFALAFVLHMKKKKYYKDLKANYYKASKK